MGMVQIIAKLKLEPGELILLTMDMLKDPRRFSLQMWWCSSEPSSVRTDSCFKNRGYLRILWTG